MPSPERKKPTIEVVTIGRLRELGLGNPNGIPTTLDSPEKVSAYVDSLKNCFDFITDTRHWGCIDGRCAVCNVDGSAPQVRARQVGGTGVLVDMALYGDSFVLPRTDQSRDASPKQLVNRLHEHAKRSLEVWPSAHQGGCGGVNGAPTDAETVATNAALPNVLKALMSIDAVRALSGVDYDPEEMAGISRRAAMACDWMSAVGWDGQTYVDGVAKDEPAGVEDLETDPEDTAFHGHREPALVIVVSKDQSLSDAKCRSEGIVPPFVMNINTSVAAAKAFAKPGDTAAYRRNLMANVAKHLAVANRLPSDETPVLLAIAA